MSQLRLAIFLLLASGGILLGGCSQGNSGDDAAAGSAAVPIGLDRFLLFPNPIVDSSGNFQTDTNAFAQAYYAAVDPNGERSSLAAWKMKNQFGTGGSEFVAVFRDVRDLGYGRRMTGRMNADGSIAFFVENYNVSKVPGGYSQVNVEAAVVRDPTWHVGTNAIEWSPAQCTAADPPPPDCSVAVKFAKYFNFDPATGQRQNMLDLDGRGQKAMPGICISCHGGRADPLTPQSTYALVENSLSRKRGDVQGKLQGFNVDSFEWSATPGFTRADQESVLKIFNQWVLCSYPGGGSVTGAWGTCTRPGAGANEWQGTAAAMIQSWYGSAGDPTMPNPEFSDTYLPTNWNTGAINVQVYRNVVVPFCRTCHLLRGTTNQSDIDFDDEAKFRSYATRIKAHVFDRGNMPLAFLVYQDFWKSNAPSILASYIDSVLGAGTATNVGGGPLRPGRPIADPGPNRMVRTGANATLYGGDSLFATTYSWTLDPSTPGATITNPNSPTATFFSSFAGNYTVHLTVSNPGLSDSKAVTITVDNNFRDPATLKFAHVKNVLQNGSTCTTCHLPRPSPQLAATPPIWYTDFDRNFSGGAADATDDAWFYSELMGRVNFTEIGDSPLLRKPTGNHHNGSTLFDLTLAAGLSNYSIIYNWILNGAPPGGVAASAGADSTNNVAFTGSPASATISLNGNSSIGATSFAWTMVSFTPTAHPNGTSPTGTAPSISSPNSASATLNIFDIGTYVVRLTVSNGADTDFADRTITVTETAVNAAASPSGTVAVSFSGAPLSGTISLDSSGSTGNPLAFAWSYSPSGLSGACGTISNATLAMATLTVPSSAVGNSCTFLLTTSNLSTTDQATTVITIASAGSGIVANAGASGSVTRTFTNPSVTLGVPDSTGIPVAPTIALSGSASTGPGTLTYTWSVIAAPGNATGSYAPSIASPSSVNTTLTVHRRGLYTVRLFVDNGLPSGPSNTADRDITVNVTSGNTFTDMKSTFVSRGCTGAGCHLSGSTVPPSWVDETVGGFTLHQRVTARVNGTDPANSSIVVCPSGGACGMGKQLGFHDADVSSYTQFLNWIIDGAQNN